MKLQFIHETRAALRASSLHCQWISARHGEGERLEAIWVDWGMRALESELPYGARIEGQTVGVGEVSSDPLQYVRISQAGGIHNEEDRQQ